MKNFQTADTTVDEFGVITYKSQNGTVTLVPGDDVSDAPDKVKAMADSIWTTDSIAQYELHSGLMGKKPSALKSEALQKIADLAETYRAKLASTSAGKLAEYRFKEEIGRDPSNASEAELELLSREAKARGTNRTGLIAQINAKAAIYREIALLIGVMEVETRAAIVAVPDDVFDIEAQIAAVLAKAKEQTDLEYQNALALISSA